METALVSKIVRKGWFEDQMAPETERSETATLEQAREHARGQAGRSARTGRIVPPSEAIGLPPGVGSQSVVWDETVDVGGYTGLHLPRGAAVAYRRSLRRQLHQLRRLQRGQPSERLNVADTVKVQWQAYLDRHIAALRHGTRPS